MLTKPAPAANETMRVPRRGLGVGPGFLVTAAFIGPGTVTSAMTAGVTFGLSLLWVVVLSTVAAIVLQEMAGRIGLVKRQPLGRVLQESTHPTVVRLALSTLIFLAILFGNTAYQSGNLLGAVKGVDLLLTADLFASPLTALSLLTLFVLIAGGLLISGNPKIVRRFLVGLVVLMSLLFFGIALQVAPPLAELGPALIPQIPANGSATTMALFGTTIVPYNLFLYASLVNDKWPADLPTRRSIWESRIDISLAVGLGGLVTGAILITGAAANDGTGPCGLAELPSRLANLVPPRLSSAILGLGLLGAGLTSAITAPLAAAYAAAGIFGWPQDLKSKQNRLILAIVLFSGWAVAAGGILWNLKPEIAILMAQAANGLVLPVIALLLWWLVSRRQVLGEYVNGRLAQVISFLVVAAIAIVWLLNLFRQLNEKLL